MFPRIFAIAMNTYREAVRARVLYGLLGLALGTLGYSVVVAKLSLHQEARVIADLGAASTSLYAILVAIVLAATSLHREVEMKTIFPILSRPLRRHEYLLGKFFGTLTTLAVFIALDAAGTLACLALQTDEDASKIGAALGVAAPALALALFRAKHTRVFVLIPGSFLLLVTMYLLSASAGGDRQLVVASAALTLCEVSIIAAFATLFSSFSTPFLTAIFTLSVFLIGRSTDRLLHLPPKYFFGAVRTLCYGMGVVFPNLPIYVPARPLLLGQVAEHPIWPYVGVSALHAIAYSAVLLVLSALIFRKRDFQ